MQLKVTFFFMSALVYQVPTWCFTPGQSCLTPNMTVPDDASCATYLICDVINHIWIKRICSYPDLYSTVSHSCDTFGTVECRARTVPMTPCEYIITCRGTPSDNCVCEKHELYGDLDWSNCIGKPDGHYPYPGRLLSPFYIECKQNRTIPTRCPVVGHFIFDHYDFVCRFIFDVITKHRALTLVSSTSSVPLFADKSSSSSSSSTVDAMSSTPFVPDKTLGKALIGKSSASSFGLSRNVSFGPSSTTAPVLQDTLLTTDRDANTSFGSSTVSPRMSSATTYGTGITRSTHLALRPSEDGVGQRRAQASTFQSNGQSKSGARKGSGRLFVVICICITLSR